MRLILIVAAVLLLAGCAIVTLEPFHHHDRYHPSRDGHHHYDRGPYGSGYYRGY